MKYLFVFLLVGLYSCGNDATSNASENIKPKLKEYWMEEVTIPNDTIAFFKKDMKPVTGIVKDKYENGQLKLERTHKDGYLDGLSRTWYENGQLYVEINYKDGKKDGVGRNWYENGQLNEEGEWQEGVIISIKRWDEDGKPIN